MYHKGIAFVRFLFVPGRCAVCGSVPVDARAAAQGICDECRAALRPDSARRCASCGRPLISEAERCSACRKTPFGHLDVAHPLFPYRGPAGELLKSFKFGDCRRSGEFVADLLATAVADLAAGGRVFDAIVPVPPRQGKIRAIGWDQVEYLARSLQRRRGLPQVSRALVRGPSAVQKRLDREGRFANLQGRVRCIGPLRARSALLLDDVMTTGATLDACAWALKAAGVSAVEALVLCYD